MSESPLFYPYTIPTYNPVEFTLYSHNTQKYRAAVQTIISRRRRRLHPSLCQLFFPGAVGPVAVVVAAGVAVGVAVVVAARAVIALRFPPVVNVQRARKRSAHNKA